MAARTMRARDRLGGAQPLEDESDTDGVDGEASVKSFVSSKLYATLLVLPGIILYVYILYIILANLLYPCSLSPFFPRNRSSSSATSDTDESAGSLCSLRSAILNNAALLVLFAAQHSLMASNGLKQLWNTLGLSAISRLMYVFSTCCTIQLIHHFWTPTPAHTLWECHGYLLTLSLKAVHSGCWLSIACSLFTIDYLELLGIKQLYYSYNGFGDPLHYKSAEQQYLLRHMRTNHERPRIPSCGRDP
ncbi:Nurim [Geodia barretti]|uniref:Nuclear envelope membrane protein n=1 Tax=Geodia barretti TaxID=519541 RepID=A0AA35RFV4_GEOBA|nr:Nurim [Geodia barretti]